MINGAMKNSRNFFNSPTSMFKPVIPIKVVDAQCHQSGAGHSLLYLPTKHRKMQVFRIVGT